MIASTLSPVPERMKAARLHVIGEDLRLDDLAVPDVRANDVLVEIKACGVVPNMRRVIANFFGTQTADRKVFPQLPAIFGLDATGVVARVGECVTSVKPGERVYVNPGRTCGSCRMCRLGRPLDCPVFTFQGYFGRSADIMRNYPYGGFGQYQTAPASALVKLPDAVSFESASRLGYLGTAYSALKKIGVGPGDVLLVNGVSGALGLCAALVALAMGVGRVLGVGRDLALLERVRAIAPDRIAIYSNAAAAGAGSDSLAQWARTMTDGAGCDAVIDCLPPGAPVSAMLDAIHTLRRGGAMANIGAVIEDLPINAFWMCANRIQLQGSVWFTVAEGEDLVAMIAAGALDLSPLDHRIVPLAQINEALHSMPNNRDGGFANYIIDPR